MVPGSPVEGRDTRSMHSWLIDRFSLATLLRDRSPVTELSVSTSKRSAMPKFAIAPMPNVPTTPAFLASSVFFPLFPAYQ